MRSLLDINVLIALLDPQHIFHERAHKAWNRMRKDGLATCPLTENGVVRILSNPTYPGLDGFGIARIVDLLRGFTKNTDHEFWADELSILNEKVFDHTLIVGPNQLTDIYLLGLAAQNNGVLVTFDERIPLSTVRSAKTRNLFNI